jgi:DNA polymerase I-like protein with 3'-5' exonuclease and polymerase domains
MSDFHQLAANRLMQVTGFEIPRRTAKAVGFAALYHSGPEALAEKIGCSIETAEKFLGAYEAITRRAVPVKAPARKAVRAA